MKQHHWPTSSEAGFTTNPRLTSSGVRTVRNLAPAGELTRQESYLFEFNHVEMQYESYRGLQVRLR